LILSFAFPPEFSRSYLAAAWAPIQRTTQERLLSWAFLPFSTCQTRGSTFGTGLPGPLRSAYRVWLPSWRVTPPRLWSALSHADSAPGILPFGAFSSRKVSPSVSTRDEPTCRSPHRSPLQANPAAEHGRLRLLGFNPYGSPLAGLPRLALTSAGCSLGLYPFQGSSANGLPPVTQRLLPRTSASQATYATCDPVPRSIDHRSPSSAANA